MGANYIFWLAVLVVSGAVGLLVQTRWMTFYQFFHQTPYGRTDPLFEKDIAFYFFSLPFASLFLELLLGLVFLSLLVAGLNYVLHGHLGFQRGLQFTEGARRYLTLLLSLLFLLMAARFWLLRFDLLFSREGIVFGAGYTDVYAWLPCYWILVALALATSALFLVSVVTRTVRLATAAALGFGIAYLLVHLYPSLIQTFVVSPNELQKEIPFICHNIQSTLHAYKLDQIEVQDFPVSRGLDQADLARNQPTLRNIRLWDWRPLKDAYDQLQSIRLYYDFEDVDVDRYVIDGSYRQVMLSVREFNFSRIAPTAQTWINQFFLYTHGYGLCMSPVNEVTEEGLPAFFIQDIPPRSNVDLRIERAEIYFGEKTDYPVFVKTRLPEFDYPLGEENATTFYQGQGGIPIHSFFMRALLAWELGIYQILFTDNFTEESRVLLHRQIRRRISKIAPFLEYDDDPYAVIHEGRILWILDAYTVSDRFPYSEPFQDRFNYIRNSVKVVVDAYHGDVTFYMADAADPLLRTYASIFPHLFQPLEALPPGLKNHIRYPEDFFDVQRSMYRIYHMEDPQVFYNQEDLWEIPTEIYRGNEQQMDSYYIIMSLPGSDREEFILLIPFTPKNKNNMIAWLAARSDGEHYGKLILYRFPKQELTFGPMQIEARIDQNPEISQLITLWSQKGSRVIRGNLLVIPIEESLLYVEPLYLQAEKSEIPELTRVIVVYGSRVAMGETLQEALQAAVLGSPPGGQPEPPWMEGSRQEPAPDSEAPALAELIAQARTYYQEGQRHLRNGDWGGYGEAQRKLGEVLQRLDEITRRP